MKPKLDDAQLADAIAGLPGWRLEHGEIVRWADFDDFNQAILFVNRLAALAEAAGHHPDIDIRYNRVRLALVTHDSGGITRLDIEMAKNIDQTLTKEHF